jgi:TPP-dependent 2-oxoacid decarboxylase
MMEKHSGVVAQIKEVAPDAKCVHCSIHREALAARKMPAILKTVLTEAVKVVNVIKSRATNQDYFRFYVMKWAASMINFFIPKFGGCHGGMC